MLSRSLTNHLQLLIPDGRVTPEGLKALVQSTGCKAWIYVEDDPNSGLTDGDGQLRTLGLPSLSWMLSKNGEARYPYDKTFAEAARDVIVIIHTSGTTGKLLIHSEVTGTQY